jgi:hypothetical protein
VNDNVIFPNLADRFSPELFTLLAFCFGTAYNSRLTFVTPALLLIAPPDIHTCPSFPEIISWSIAA